MRIALVVLVACSSPTHGGLPPIDAAAEIDTPLAIDAAPLGNRDRLLQTYLAYLQGSPTTQTNGLSGAALHSRCELWAALAPSPRATFLTITARLAGGKLADGSTMLDHITTLYRAVGGDGATATAPGSCGGGEANRLMMAMDPTLHAALVTTNTMAGGTSTARIVTDIPSGGYWRDSHDAGGPHAPFDLSDETNDGAPRGQTQFFRDPTSTAATSALGRTDLTTLVQPYALEMDEDFDCTHNSNPSCDYTLYGALCAPKPTEAGTAIYVETYGDFDPTWHPAGC